MAGRTIFGAPAPKGQELEDQYFGAIKDRVSDYMNDLNTELWKMGITSKTQHNEVAPAQYEMAPIFATTNIATDHNQLVMETMQKVALRHDLVCLLHEKPFAGINGSGKHNNWSLSTDDGINLLEPGHTPQRKRPVPALLERPDQGRGHPCRYPAGDLRQCRKRSPPRRQRSAAGDHLHLHGRGAHGHPRRRSAEGKKISAKGAQFVKVGVDTLPELPKDNTDRNRTSPFAFTGNKFEFRMVGSSQSIAGPNVALNTIAAEALDEIATRLEKAKDKNAEAAAIIREIYKKHSRVIFNGNNYSDEWPSRRPNADCPT